MKLANNQLNELITLTKKHFPLAVFDDFNDTKNNLLRNENDLEIIQFDSFLRNAGFPINGLDIKNINYVWTGESVEVHDDKDHADSIRAEICYAILLSERPHNGYTLSSPSYFYYGGANKMLKTGEFFKFSPRRKHALYVGPGASLQMLVFWLG